MSFTQHYMRWCNSQFIFAPLFFSKAKNFEVFPCLIFSGIPFMLDRIINKMSIKEILTDVLREMSI